MAQQKTVSLMGRLAVQLKMITMDQLTEATAEQGREPNKRLGDIFVEKGRVNPGQIEKLKKLQRDLVAKHRAKQAVAGAGGAAGPRPEPERPFSKGAKPAPEAAAPGASSPPAAPEAPDPSPSAPPEAGAAAPDAPPPRSVPPQAASRAPAEPAQAAPIEPLDSASGDSLDLEIGSSGEEDRQRLHELLREAVQAGASDVHIHSGACRKLRINGEMTEVDAEPLSLEEAERLTLAALSENERLLLARHGELDLCYSVEGVGRFRTNVYRQQRGIDAVFRAIPAEPPTLEELELPNALAKFTNFHQGMVLITGPAGCGKSSTMAALTNLVNEEREEHILTVEDPIEYVHVSKRCLVNQRHAGRHTVSFARALRSALREDPDVIVIGELRDLETISLAMTAAETGHFVLATLHTNNAVRTINRMIGAFPSNQQGQVRTMLSESLRAVVSQRLVKRADGSGRVPALEILVINKAIGNLIRDQKTVQIRSSIQTGSSQGMCLLEQSLNELVRDGTVTREEALRHAEDQKLVTG